jgi:polyhydroxyalkanoate synthesis regulator phasin
MAQSGAPDDLLSSLIAVRERLVSSLTLTTDRLQETMEDAVRRGRLTRHDAEELLSALVTAGRTQTDILLEELEELLARGGSGPQEVVRRGVGRARRHMAVGPPIADYDQLSATDIIRRLDGLTDAQVRRVGEHEAAGKARKTVLAAVAHRGS